MALCVFGRAVLSAVHWSSTVPCAGGILLTLCSLVITGLPRLRGVSLFVVLSVTTVGAMLFDTILGDWVGFCALRHRQEQALLLFDGFSLTNSCFRSLHVYFSVHLQLFRESLVSNSDN